MPNLQDYLTIKDAAAYLGVTPNTLRNWGEAGKIREYRHPANNYRLYKTEALDEFLKQIERSPPTRRTRRPKPTKGGKRTRQKKPR